MGDIDPQKAEAFGAAGPMPVWYHGRLSRGEAEARLQGKPDGTFLLRDSTSSKGDFVLSASESRRVSHYIVQRQGKNDYHIGDQPFFDLPAVIDFYKKHLLDTTTLSAPLPLDQAAQDGVLYPHFLFEVIALYNFNARDAEDLSFRRGEKLNVLEQREEQWWRAQSLKTLQIGVIPANYVKKTTVDPEPAPEPPSLAQRSSKPLQRTDSVMNPAPATASRKKPPPLPDSPPAQPRVFKAPAPDPPAAAVAAPAAGTGKPAAVLPLVAARQRPESQKNKPLPALPPPPDVDKQPDRPKFLAARAHLDRVANAYDPSALSFKTGDVIQITTQNENGLWEGMIVDGTGKVGHFPFTLVELLDSEEYDDELQDLQVAFEVQMDEIYGMRK